MQKLLAQGSAGSQVLETPPQISTQGDLGSLLDRVINFALIFIGLAVFIYLIYGGVTYITAGGDAEKAGKGRVVITNAIVGLVIVIAAFLIYRFVITGLNTGVPQ